MNEIEMTEPPWISDQLTTLPPHWTGCQIKYLPGASQQIFFIDLIKASRKSRINIFFYYKNWARTIKNIAEEMYTLEILGPKRVFPREFKSLIERCLEIFVHKNVYIKIVAHF